MSEVIGFACDENTEGISGLFDEKSISDCKK